MTEWTRREWTKAMLAGLAAAVPAAATGCAKPKVRLVDRRVHGVSIGVRSASFMERTLDEALQAMKVAGIGACELASGHVEPRDLTGPKGNRELLRRWRLQTPLEQFAAIRAKFDEAGIALLAYGCDLGSDFSDAELERAFVVAQTMRVTRIATSSPASLIRRCAHFAREYRIQMALTNAAQAAPDALVTFGELSKVAGMPPEIGVALDLGAFTAAGQDALAWLKQHWKRTLILYLSDRKRGQGPSVAWGEGDAPIAPVLRLLRDKRRPIPVMIDYSYAGRDAIDEVRHCLAFCEQALAPAARGVDTPRGGA